MGVRRSNGNSTQRKLMLTTLVAAIALTIAAAGPWFEGAFHGARQPANQYSAALVEPAAAEVATAPSEPQPAPDPALSKMLDEHIQSIHGVPGYEGSQAVLVETLDGQVLMAHNAEKPLNPASVLKMATTVAALERFGPQHRFRTLVLADGSVADGRLTGSLAIRSDGDPTFGRRSIAPIVSALRSAGIRRVDGDLVIAGPLTFHTTDETPAAARRLENALERAGIHISGQARLADQVGGTEIVVVESEPLLDIVQRQNARSINRIADNLATAVGGPSGMRDYLINDLGVEPDEVHVTNGSGLDDNLLSAQAVMRVLHRLVDVSEREGIALDRLMPLNGVDRSTMRSRMTRDGMRGTVLAKTGTQSTWGGGVASLAGVAYSKERGPVLFVILNTVGSVYDYRDWQDDLLEEMLAELGGPQPVGRMENTVPSGPEGHTATVLTRGQPPAPSPAQTPAAPVAPQRDPFAAERAD